MSLSRKHFRQIADILYDFPSQYAHQTPQAMKETLVHEFTVFCIRNSANFDRGRFYDACFPDNDNDNDQ